MAQLFKKVHGLFTLDYRKIVQELLERVPAREIVQKTLREDTSSGKNGCTTHYVSREETTLVSRVVFMQSL